MSRRLRNGRGPTKHGGGPWVLGVGASHNGAACLLHGDEIVVAVQEERLTGRKRERVWGGAEAFSIRYCLSYAGIGPSDLDALVVCVAGRAHSQKHNVRAHPLFRELAPGVPILTIPHHLGHAVSAFATSGFREAAVLVVDGLGSPEEDLSADERAAVRKKVEDGWETISLYAASDAAMVPLEKHLVAGGRWLEPAGEGMPRFGSLGGLYSAVASQVFGSSMEAGKVMGLAPYGSPRLPAGDFFDIRGGEFVFRDTVPKMFDRGDRWPARREEYSDLACSAQAALEGGLIHLAARLRELCPSENLCYAGGVALNSVANERIIRESGYRRVHIIPAAEDSGTAVGAAYYGLWRLTGRNTGRRMTRDACGRPYTPREVSAAAGHVERVRTHESDDIISDAAELLCAGMTVGWFAGRSELGPRALGQRSILCDPRRPDAKAVLNGRVKRREGFRPFAPAILLEEVGNWFEAGDDLESPFMLRVCRFREDKIHLVPAVVHVDRTGRVQTLTREANGTFYELVQKFHERTGVPLVLNTSFNVMGRPIVETPEDALACLVDSGLDCVVFEDRIAYKHVAW